MLEVRYEVEFDENFDVFEFISVGPKGAIRKAVHYVEIYPNIYNLGFGDKDPLTNEIDDRVVTNNGDSEKVLLTVVYTLFLFTDRYPDAFIIATGSTPARTRLYRMSICNNLEIVKKHFYVSGRKGKVWYPFDKNVDYGMFSVKRKL